MRPVRRVRAHKAAQTNITGSRDLIGPPCPLSNLRPVYYAPLFPSSSQSAPANHAVHPYRLQEFADSDHAALGRAERHLLALKQQLQTADLEWRLTRYRIDRFNQDFWAKTNAHFLRQRDAFVAEQADKTGADPATVDLAPFYARHLADTKSAYARYNATLWKMQYATLWPALMAVLRRWRWQWAVWTTRRA